MECYIFFKYFVIFTILISANDFFSTLHKHLIKCICSSPPHSSSDGYMLQSTGRRQAYARVNPCRNAIPPTTTILCDMRKWLWKWKFPINTHSLTCVVVPADVVCIVEQSTGSAEQIYVCIGEWTVDGIFARSSLFPTASWWHCNLINFWIYHYRVGRTEHWIFPRLDIGPR